MRRLLLFLFITIGFLITVYFAIFIYPRSLRPPRTNNSLALFQGITYQREAYQNPRRMMVHIVTIDLTVANVIPFVTPGLEEINESEEVLAQTTQDFLNEFDLQIAINAGFFDPFYYNSPWDYSPKSGQPVDIVGLAMSDGRTYSVNTYKQPVLCFDSTHSIHIHKSTCPKDTLHAIAGNRILVEDGVAGEFKPTSWLNQPHPRTAVGIDDTEETLWLILVDGRQNNYSEGITLDELVQIIIDLGADQAINLDGGGSTTLVVQTQDGAEVLNAPIDRRIPMNQRPVGNHLGLYVK